MEGSEEGRGQEHAAEAAEVGDQLTYGGAQRWISLGFFNLQPSELAKLMLVITLASYYSRKEVTDGYTLRQLIIPIVLTTIPFLLILLQPDLGTALMMVFILAHGC